MLFGPAPKRLSKSLEALNCGAMWSSFVEEIVLDKGERGLGFSILDYQVIFWLLWMTFGSTVQSDPTTQLCGKKTLPLTWI